MVFYKRKACITSAPDGSLTSSHARVSRLEAQTPSRRQLLERGVESTNLEKGEKESGLEPDSRTECVDYVGSLRYRCAIGQGGRYGSLVNATHGW